ncbi:hypothetical protein MHBO_002412 [Bonamia ostreae]|uniref:Uncharacterized protein n=1 Tax=Bonamia ostreae TaxID=126728 RepID=A0ABV2AM70_9EUKA
MSKKTFVMRPNGAVLFEDSFRLALRVIFFNLVNSEHEAAQQTAELITEYDPCVFYSFLSFNTIILILLYTTIGFSVNAVCNKGVFVFVCVYAGGFIFRSRTII